MPGRDARRAALGHGRLGGGRSSSSLNLFAMIATVVVNSFATRWLGTWLPAGFTTRWYSAPGASSSSTTC